MGERSGRWGKVGKGLCEGLAGIPAANASPYRPDPRIPQAFLPARDEIWGEGLPGPRNQAFGAIAGGSSGPWGVKKKETPPRRGSGPSGNSRASGQGLAGPAPPCGYRWQRPGPHGGQRRFFTFLLLESAGRGTGGPSVGRVRPRASRPADFLTGSASWAWCLRRPSGSRCRRSRGRGARPAARPGSAPTRGAARADPIDRPPRPRAPRRH